MSACGHDLLIALALKLPCMYPRDDCNKHLQEEGFTRCPMCVCRDEAEAVRRRVRA